MRMSLAILAIIICSQVQAQDYYSHSKLKVGGGYTKDFPGLSGYGLVGEYAYSLNEYLEGGFGVKRFNLSGYPRTLTVNEYTKATTLDFNIFFLPFTGETSVLKIGAGYSFSFYKIRRSYPLFETHGQEKTTSWPLQDAKGRTSGITFSGEYEYIFPSNFSLGIKASFCKAYDRVFYVGPFLGVRL